MSTWREAGIMGYCGGNGKQHSVVNVAMFVLGVSGRYYLILLKSVAALKERI